MMHPAEPDARPQSTLWMLDLGQPLPVGPVLRVPVAFTRAGPEVAQELAQAMDLDDQAMVVQRFDNGRHCYVGRIEGRLATYGWVTFDEEDIGELSLSIRLKAGEAYIWNCATLPAYRGQRLYPALLTHIVGELHHQGAHRVWICTDTDNLPSQSGIVLAGLQPTGDVFISRVLTMRRAWLRGRPGISERLVMDARQALLGGREEVWLATNSDELSAGTMYPHLGQPLVLAGEPPGRARAAMIMLHGRGATAQDILTLTPDLHSPGFIYLAPHAAGNTWYPNSFLAPFATNEPDLSSGLAVITSLLDQLAQVGIPAERTILLGFSQGACLLLEYIARNPRRYGGVVGLSGGLIGPDGTPRNYPGSLAGTPVFLGCSDTDPHIAKERVEQAAEALRLIGGNVTTRLYPHMDHTVNQDELRFVLGMMASILPISTGGVNPMPKQDNEKTTQGVGPLDGLLIADFSRVLAGPYCTMLLGDLGATVIKVESPAGDDTRTWMPPERNGVSTYYMAINRNKRSITLDLNDSADLRLAHELAARADVFIENFKPGGLKRFGLDYDAVQQRNTGIIYASISGFGTAQGASLPGYDLIVQAMSGLMSLTGDADGPAYRSGISVFDVMAGLHATIGILAALNHRNHTGEGQHVEVSLFATALSGMVNHTTAYVAGGVVPHRMGNAHPSLFPYESLPTADLDLIIAAGNNGQFGKLCEILDLPELLRDPRFANTKDRTRNREALRPLLVERLRTRTANEWFRMLSAAGVPCGPINNVEGGVTFAREIGLNPVVEVGTGDDAVPMIRHPISFSLTPPRHDLPPPALGQDNEQIRAWLSQTIRIGPEELKTTRTTSEQ